MRLLRDFRRYLFLFFWCFDGFFMLIRFFKDLEGFLAIARDSLKDYWPSFRYLWDLWELLAFSRGRYGFLRVTQPNFGHSHPVFGHLRPLWRGSRRHFSLLSSSEQFFFIAISLGGSKTLDVSGQMFWILWSFWAFSNFTEDDFFEHQLVKVTKAATIWRKRRNQCGIWFYGPIHRSWPSRKFCWSALDGCDWSIESLPHLHRLFLLSGWHLFSQLYLL